MRKFILFFLSLTVIAFAQDVEFEGKQEQDDIDALRQWIRDKRLITVKEIGGDLSISGEVRTEYQGTNEKLNGIKQRGSGGATNRPTNAFDVEVNLMFDYRTDRTWAAIRLEFDNDMGIVSGTTNRVSLEKAYFGGRIIDGDTFTWDGELGRRFLSNVFDSKIEFGPLYDGLLLRFSKAFISIGDFYVTPAIFLVNENTDHFGSVAELGALQIANTGFYIKYSIINWKKDPFQRENNLRFNFVNSQLLFGWQFSPSDKLVKPYIAGLINHAARPVTQTGFKKANLAWYAGISIGTVRKQGDWALDANYQWVQAQAIPEFDTIGLGRGNAARTGMYTTGLDGGGAPTTQATAVGTGNYKGWVVEVLYAFTNNITLLQAIRVTRTLDPSIGPMIRYKQFETEFIYAF